MAFSSWLIWRPPTGKIIFTDSQASFPASRSFKPTDIPSGRRQWEGFFFKKRERERWAALTVLISSLNFHAAKPCGCRNGPRPCPELFGRFPWPCYPAATADKAAQRVTWFHQPVKPVEEKPRNDSLRPPAASQYENIRAASSRWHDLFIEFSIGEIKAHFWRLLNEAGL